MAVTETEVSEHRTIVAGETDCIRCGKTVELVAETEQWEQRGDGSWVHSDYGPGHGVCCGIAYLEDYYSDAVLGFDLDPDSPVEDSEGDR